ncbi:MAG: PD40 domain-containing protein [Chloroflexota bacterium]|nr:PD40 domain-containing protein [Chloroflexota bacterium]
MLLSVAAANAIDHQRSRSAPAAATLPSTPTASPQWQDQLIADVRRASGLGFTPLLTTYAPGSVDAAVTSVDACGSGAAKCLQYDLFSALKYEPVLRVLEGPAGCCLDGVRPNARRDIEIRPGVSGEYEPVDAAFGGPILWWVENEGHGATYVAIDSSTLSEEELIRVANSMRPLPPVGAAAPTAPPAPLRVVQRPVPRPSPLADPVVINAVPAAGAIAIAYDGATRTYDGRAGTLGYRPPARAPTEHPAPVGSTVAVERLVPTAPASRFLVAKELAVRDGGVERVVYRAPGSGFYWSGWSPDGRYVALWEIDQFSSADLDGRPLVVVDVRTGQRTDLGRTLLNGTTAWTAPHTLAYVAGASRVVWEHKTLRLWTSEHGITDVTPASVAAFAPVWSSDGRRLYFIAGPPGGWDPLSAANGRGVGDRRIDVYDAATGAVRALPHAPGYVEEGVRPSRDGSRLLVLRRRIVHSADLASTRPEDLEVWLTEADGRNGTPLVGFPGYGLGYYGYYTGPSEWTWSE